MSGRHPQSVIREDGPWWPEWKQALPQLVDEAMVDFAAVAGQGRIRLTVRALSLPEEVPRRIDAHWVDTARPDAGRCVTRRLLEHVLPTCGTPFDGFVEVTFAGDERRTWSKRLRIGRPDAELVDLYRREARHWARVARDHRRTIRDKDRQIQRMFSNSAKVIAAAGAALEQARPYPEQPADERPDPLKEMLEPLMELAVAWMGSRVTPQAPTGGDGAPGADVTAGAGSAAAWSATVSPDPEIAPEYDDAHPSGPPPAAPLFDSWRLAGVVLEGVVLEE